MFARILLPVDEAEDMQQLIDTVAALGTAFRSRVTVLHFRERQITTGASRARETVHDAAAFGRKVADELTGRGVEATITIDSARPDNVGRRIAEKAEEIDAELIVVGGHHAHNVKERILGDLGKVLAHRARCPLLMLPSPHR